MRLTLCLSICKDLKFGSKRSLSGSKLTGDWRLPLLHSDHSGFINPQKAGPETLKKKKIKMLPWEKNQSNQHFLNIPLSAIITYSYSLNLFHKISKFFTRTTVNKSLLTLSLLKLLIEMTRWQKAPFFSKIRSKKKKRKEIQ